MDKPLTAEELKELAEMLQKLPAPKPPSYWEEYEASLTPAGAKLYDRELMTSTLPPGREDEN